MTANELLQYRSLKQELEEVKEEINSQGLQDVVKGSSPEYPYTDRCYTISGHINNLTLKRLYQKQRNILKQCDDIENYVDSIGDSLTRRIFEYRYIRGNTKPSWQQIAKVLNEYDEQLPRKRHNRYLGKKNKKI